MRVCMCMCMCMCMCVIPCVCQCDAILPQSSSCSCVEHSSGVARVPFFRSHIINVQQFKNVLFFLDRKVHCALSTGRHNKGGFVMNYIDVIIHPCACVHTRTCRERRYNQFLDRHSLKFALRMSVYKCVRTHTQTHTHICVYVYTRTQTPTPTP